eukprot:3430892-Amphidinium_carterae.1
MSCYSEERISSMLKPLLQLQVNLDGRTAPPYVLALYCHPSKLGAGEGGLNSLWKPLTSPFSSSCGAVSYTHLTLPTILLV